MIELENIEKGIHKKINGLELEELRHWRDAIESSLCIELKIGLAMESGLDFGFRVYSVYCYINRRLEKIIGGEKNGGE